MYRAKEGTQDQQEVDVEATGISMLWNVVSGDLCGICREEVLSSVNSTRSATPKKEKQNIKIRKNGPISINSKGHVIRFIKDRKIFSSDRQWTTS